MSDEDESDESETAKKFDAILKDIKIIGRTTKLMSLQSLSSNISLNPLLIKLLKAGKTGLKKDYEFDEVFDIFSQNR